MSSEAARASQWRMQVSSEARRDYQSHACRVVSFEDAVEWGRDVSANINQRQPDALIINGRTLEHLRRVPSLSSVRRLAAKNFCFYKLRSIDFSHCEERAAA